MQSSITKFKNEENKKSNTKKFEVLFQKMGETWFVFSEVNGEVVYSQLPEGVSPHTTSLELYQVIDEHMEKVDKIKTPFKNKRRPEATA